MPSHLPESPRYLVRGVNKQSRMYTKTKDAERSLKPDREPARRNQELSWSSSPTPRPHRVPSSVEEVGEH